MKLTWETTKYVFRNFIRLIPFAIIPALVMALVFQRGDLKIFLAIAGSEGGYSGSFHDILQVFSVVSSSGWWQIVLVYVLLVFFLSALYGAVERHVRTGKFSFSKPFSRINDNIIAIAAICLLFIVVYELGIILLAAMLHLVNVTMPGALAPMTVILMCLLATLFLLAISQFMTWIPHMTILGNSFTDACVYSARDSVGHRGELGLSIILPIAVVALLSVVTNLSFVPDVVAIFVNMIYYLFIIVYYIANILIAFFHVRNEPRKDLKKRFGRF